MLNLEKCRLYLYNEERDQNSKWLSYFYTVGRAFPEA